MALHDKSKLEIVIEIYKWVIEATKPYIKYKSKSRGSFLTGIKKDDAKDVIGFYVCNLIDLKEQKLKTYLTSFT